MRFVREDGAIYRVEGSNKTQIVTTTKGAESATHVVQRLHSTQLCTSKVQADRLAAASGGKVYKIGGGEK